MVSSNGKSIYTGRCGFENHKVPPHCGCFTTRGVRSRLRHHVKFAGRRTIRCSSEKIVFPGKCSEEQRLRDLISGMQLGDRKPSRLLLEMRSKAENKIREELLKSLFLQRHTFSKFWPFPTTS
ncbi:hypothetical protein AVEN_103910-1 [Araneus ventricosus]|uniref:Uncharacterized protein n=1 Tax=Araneus ventricosus TaxID=182803 RepID=A0A4Y2NK00_ARAVE|nr:hypothetical protein AVEN_103910-1 [Araneus ventricosus]